MAVHPGIAARRIAGDSSGAAVEFLEIMIDQVLEARLDAAIIFARDEDEGVGSREAVGKRGHGLRRFAGRVVAVALVEHG